MKSTDLTTGEKVQSPLSWCDHLETIVLKSERSRKTPDPFSTFNSVFVQYL